MSSLCLDHGERKGSPSASLSSFLFFPFLPSYLTRSTQRHSLIPTPKTHIGHSFSHFLPFSHPKRNSKIETFQQQHIQLIKHSKCNPTICLVTRKMEKNKRKPHFDYYVVSLTLLATKNPEKKNPKNSNQISQSVS